MTDYSSDKELTDLDVSQYNIVTYERPAEAIGVIATLLHFDYRYAKMPMSQVINEITSSVAGNNYVVVVRQVGEKIQPVALLGWKYVNEYTLLLQANDIRPLSPAESNQGDICLLSVFSSPFSSPHQMMEFMQENSKKLQSLKEVVGLDSLFNPVQY